MMISKFLFFMVLAREPPLYTQSEQAIAEGRHLCELSSSRNSITKPSASNVIVIKTHCEHQRTIEEKTFPGPFEMTGSAALQCFPSALHQISD
ncbi:hypothetical protein B0T16DRAFT_225574 [Cercophora newfieldiana]|uniref:Uncharacterized protein n=1 Tax=Cercophora newfieldiana TaxID=92897 RepID=A0AA39XXQ0_9PEZI|nr:hypothetical protein B0T16DRAFT_225574 [Cercophora newfieldiana]